MTFQVLALLLFHLENRTVTHTSGTQQMFWSLYLLANAIFVRSIQLQQDYVRLLHVCICSSQCELYTYCTCIFRELTYMYTRHERVMHTWRAPASSGFSCSLLTWVWRQNNSHLMKSTCNRNVQTTVWVWLAIAQQIIVYFYVLLLKISE